MASLNLVKSEFAKATVQFLGHMVGQGQVSPVMAKVEAINSYQVPDNKKALMRYLGMCGYYRKYCKNFSDVVAPRTGLLKKGISLQARSENFRSRPNLIIIHTCGIIGTGTVQGSQIYHM